MDNETEITRHARPLSNIVICCTSIPADERQSISKMAQDMGARHTLDLTSEVTHLICGDIRSSSSSSTSTTSSSAEINSPKYKYVAKMRGDVKVMNSLWVRAMHERWVAGEDFSVAEVEVEGGFFYAAFEGLRVSLTGVLDVAEREKIRDLIIAHKGSYHPDLTKRVTHLVAAAPSGRKYEFAKGNGIRTVSVEWLYDSVQRGMALDEVYYDPKLPKELRGVGAKPEVVAVPVEPVEIHGKRKIRKNAEEKLGSQSENIWHDIIGQAANEKPKKRDEWEDLAAPHVDLTVLTQDSEKPETTTTTAVTGVKGGIFGDIGVFIYGFQPTQEKTVRTTLASHDAKVVDSLQALSELCGSVTTQLFVVVPSALRKRECPDLSEHVGITIVTEWWIENCLHQKCFVDPAEDFTLTPFEETPVPGFKGMDICLTMFTGIQLLHLSRLIVLLGANYCEWLSSRRTLLISNTPVGGDKFNYAYNNNIPIVGLRWLQECVKNSRKMPFEDFIVTPSGGGKMGSPAGRKRRRMEMSGERGEKKVMLEKKFLLGDKWKKRKSGNDGEGPKLVREEATTVQCSETMAQEPRTSNQSPPAHEPSPPQQNQPSAPPSDPTNPPFPRALKTSSETPSETAARYERIKLLLGQITKEEIHKALDSPPAHSRKPRPPLVGRATTSSAELPYYARAWSVPLNPEGGAAISASGGNTQKSAPVDHNNEEKANRLTNLLCEPYTETTTIHQNPPGTPSPKQSQSQQVIWWDSDGERIKRKQQAKITGLPVESTPRHYKCPPAKDFGKAGAGGEDGAGGKRRSKRRSGVEF